MGKRSGQTPLQIRYTVSNIEMKKHSTSYVSRALKIKIMNQSKSFSQPQPMNCLSGFFITFFIAFYVFLLLFLLYLFRNCTYSVISLRKWIIWKWFGHKHKETLKYIWMLYNVFFFNSLQYSVNHFILPQTGNMFYIVLDNLLELCLIIHGIIILSTIYGVWIIYLYFYKNVYKDTFITLLFTISSNAVFLIRCSFLLNFYWVLRMFRYLVKYYSGCVCEGVFGLS